MPRRSILLFAGACIAIAAALAFATVMVMNGRDRTAQVAEAGTGTADIGGPFQMTDQNGRAVDQTILEGQWSLVFFGFTYCPDYCPTTLAMLEATKRQLGAEGEDLQIVFVSIDPERDTPEALNNYLSSDGFPDGIVGLTGTPEQVATTAEAYKAFYEKVGEGDAYTMNHSLTLYLMGPDGRFRAPLSHDLGPQRAADVIRRVQARG
jgi:protein SCO1